MFAAFRSRNAIDSAARCAVRAMMETLETRQLLSAGDLDTSFATGGWRVEGTNSGYSLLARQTDGKLVAVGTADSATLSAPEQTRIHLTRYNSDGTLDTTFGTGGVVVTDAVPGPESPESILVQSDGKIVVAESDPSKGDGTDTLQVVRYNTNGTLDTAFGTGGIFYTNQFASGNQLNQLANGKLVISGNADPGIEGEDLFFARLNTNGTPDTTFDGDGYAQADLGYYDILIGADVHSDGTIGFVGRAAKGNAGDDIVFGQMGSNGALDPSFPLARIAPSGSLPGAFAVESGMYLLGYQDGIRRYTAHGVVDNTFGTNGLASTKPSLIRVRPDGKIVAVYGTQGYPDTDKIDVQVLTANGAPDTSFSSDGTAEFGFSADNLSLSDALVQPDNKLVVLGGVEYVNSGPVLARVQTNGSQDTSFSGDGWATPDFAGKRGAAEDVAIQSDGKIVVVGYSLPVGGSQLMLRRYNTNGTPDTTFSGDGLVTIDNATGWKVVIQPDGKILVGGDAVYRFTSSGALDTSFGGGDGIANYGGFALALSSDGKIYAAANDDKVRRLNSNGSLDTSFGSSGVRSLVGSTPALSFGIYDLDVQSDGKILATGTGFPPPEANSDQGYAIARLNSDGSVDTAFGTDGWFQESNDHDDIAHAAVVQPDGKIVVVSNEGDGDMNIIRLNADGSVDPNFGATGAGLYHLPVNSETYPMDVALQSDGKIVVGGRTEPTGYPADMFLIRLNTDGTLDASFSGDGEATYSFADAPDYGYPSYDDQANAFAIDSSGRFVLVGSVGPVENTGFVALARVQGGGSSDRAQLASTGELIINGTSGNDTITVAPSGSNIVATVNGVSKSFLASSVTSATIMGVAGNDTITINSALTLDTFIYGGTGDDKITDGGGNSQLFGGDGNDWISDGPGNDFATAETVVAGLGDDHYGATLVDYSARTADLTITLDGNVASGQAGESDYIDARQVKGGSGNDLIIGNHWSGYNEVLMGGKGNDTLRGDSGDDALFGEDGNDQLEGGTGNDFLSGGTGNDSMYGQEDNDTLDGGLGADFFQGSGGIDLADYQFRSENLTISLDNAANDGAAGEGDNVSSDIENINGGSGADRIVATAQNNYIQANGGNDTVYAGDGNDTIFGGSGADALFGQGDDDTIYALDGTRDSLDGGDGTDVAQRDTGSVTDSVVNIESFGGSTNTLTGFTFDDTNDNAQFDAGEKKTGGKTVYLDTNNNGVLDSGEQSTVTDSSGNFTFANLADGTYHVRRVFPSGWTYSTALIDVNASGGQTIGNLAIGSISTSTVPPQVGSISGFTFDDTNFDGQYTPGEPKTSGKTVFIDTNGNNQLDSGEQSTVTDINGAWTFQNLPEGTYEIRRVYPSGYEQSTPLLSASIGPGEDVSGIAIGSKPISAPPVETASLNGFTFDDTNVDGMYESPEKVTGGKTVFLDTNNNGKFDAGETSAITNSDGLYNFTGLAAGTYHIRRVFPSGYTYSTAPIDVTVNGGDNLYNLAIGSKPTSATPPPQTGSISGFAFNDTNTNGQYDSGETKTGGKTIFLDSNNNGKLDSGEKSFVTDSSGAFTFSGLVAGTYHVRRVFPSGWTYSTAPIDLVLGDGQNVNNLAIGSKAIA